VAIAIAAFLKSIFILLVIDFVNVQIDPMDPAAVHRCFAAAGSSACIPHDPAHRYLSIAGVCSEDT
jgi:hypothetical protein